MQEVTHVRHSRCRCCEAETLTPVLDLGEMPLAGGFLKEDEIPGEQQFPLVLQFCRTCSLVQVNDAISGTVLFQRYFYFSSAIGTLVEHFANLAAEVKSRFLDGKTDPFVTEIGSNDGVLLRPLRELGIRALGVDPAENVVEVAKAAGLDVVNDFFGEQVARKIRERHGPADVILSSYSFAHIDTMIDVIRGIKALLKEDGVFICEVHYLGDMVEELQYDMVYHEHFNYYSLAALEYFFARHDMEVFDVLRLPLRTGTIRCYVRHRGGRPEPVSDAVEEVRAYEDQLRLARLDTLLKWGERVRGTRAEMLGLLGELKAKGKRVIGYGASGRASTIMNFVGLDRRYLDCVVDDAPAKHGYLTPGSHVPIKSWAEAAGDGRPDYALVFAWPFIEEVKRRRADYLEEGGQFIVPLPQVHVVGAGA
ncbi:MAG: class I SAM-dependent methyltransferase [Chloroflexota bacterium]